MQDNNGEKIKLEPLVFGERRRTEGLELSTSDIADDEFVEVFKQFHKIDPETIIEKVGEELEKLEIIDYQVLYRKGVECAYITILQTTQQEGLPILFVFSEEDENTKAQSENKPIQVENIFGADAYQNYIELGWSDISQTENTFPWPIKAWLAQNMKQDLI